MILLRQRCVLGVQRKIPSLRFFSGASSYDMEFTIAPYVDVPALGFQKSDKFCMLTLKYPAFQGLPEEKRHAMYEQKKARRAQFVQQLFDHYDVNKSGYLCKDELQGVLKDIGLAFDDGSVQGMLQRKDKDNSGNISRKEFPEVVKEAWGQIPTMVFSDKLGDVYPGETPLDGDRVVMFLGRTSPAGWALRSVRNLCPYALRGCQILQNVCNNPEMNPEYMEEWMVDHHGGPVKDVEGVAETAAGNLPTAAGGLMVRLDAVDPPSDGQGTIYVPLRGLSLKKKSGLRSWLGF